MSRDSKHPPPPASGRDDDLKPKSGRRPQVIVCAGGGGVGKTTTSAAIALALAWQGKRTLVITVDPARRLAAAAGLFVGRQPLVDALPHLSSAEPEDWFRQARALLDPPAALSYWQTRLSLGGTRQKREIALIGEGRLAAILSNVAIPFLAATGWPIVPLLPHLPPEEDNSLIRQTAHALFGRDHNPAAYHDGLKQQGLMQVFHDFCLNNRSACSDCQLTTALANCVPAATIDRGEGSSKRVE